MANAPAILETQGPVPVFLWDSIYNLPLSVLQSIFSQGLPLGVSVLSAEGRSNVTKIGRQGFVTQASVSSSIGFPIQVKGGGSNGGILTVQQAEQA